MVEDDLQSERLYVSWPPASEKMSRNPVDLGYVQLNDTSLVLIVSNTNFSTQTYPKHLEPFQSFSTYGLIRKGQVSQQQIALHHKKLLKIASKSDFRFKNLILSILPRNLKLE